MNGLSDFLYARASVAEGIARLIDFGGTLQVYNSALSAEQADAIAIAADWKAVGADMEKAMASYSEIKDRMTEELLIEARKSLGNIP
jgi:hypothetical protein